MGRCWLVKSEPDAFSFDDLVASPGGTTSWDGIRNYQVRNFMRDEMRVGDRVLYYHSGKAPGVVGVAEIASAARADPTQFDEAARGFDPASTRADPRWLMVDLRAVRALPRTVPLAEIKARPELASMAVARRGNRLSVMPEACEHVDAVIALAEA